MKIKAKNGFLPRGIDISGIEYKLINSLNMGKECMVNEIPTKLKKFVEEVKPKKVQEFKVKIKQEEKE